MFRVHLAVAFGHGHWQQAAARTGTTGTPTVFRFVHRPVSRAYQKGTRGIKEVSRLEIELVRNMRAAVYVRVNASTIPDCERRLARSVDLHVEAHALARIDK